MSLPRGSYKLTYSKHSLHIPNQTVDTVNIAYLSLCHCCSRQSFWSKYSELRCSEEMGKKKDILNYLLQFCPKTSFMKKLEQGSNIPETDLITLEYYYSGDTRRALPL